MSSTVVPAGDAAAPPPSPGYRFVRDHGERAEGINAMFNRFTGRSRTLEAYRWEWFEGAGESFVWAIVDPEDRVVGHHGIVPTPLVVAGQTVPAGRTENTIIEAAVRKKIFYPGMEKKAFTEVLRSLAVLYTVHASGPQARIRERLGYRPVGRWMVYLPVVRAGYLLPLAARAKQRLAPRLPDAVAAAGARLAGAVLGLSARLSRPPAGMAIDKVSDWRSFEGEYRAFWQQARPRYDITIDRSWEFLSWRVFRNPNLRFEAWALRRSGVLESVVIGHEHRLGSATSLYVDDLLTREYTRVSFQDALRALPHLLPHADAVVVMTLDVDTPLAQALRAAYPLQSAILRRVGEKLFDEVVVYDRDGVCRGGKWFVSPLFTEGLDTSRSE